MALSMSCLLNVVVYLTPTGGEKILHQEDSTCEIDGEWKRINTLEHFLVRSLMMLDLLLTSDYFRLLEYLCFQPLVVSSMFVL